MNKRNYKRVLKEMRANNFLQKTVDKLPQKTFKFAMDGKLPALTSTPGDAADSHTTATGSTPDATKKPNATTKPAHEEETKTAEPFDEIQHLFQTPVTALHEDGEKEEDEAQLKAVI